MVVPTAPGAGYSGPTIGRYRELGATRVRGVWVEAPRVPRALSYDCQVNVRPRLHDA